MNNDLVLNNRLKELRTAKKLSQEELARMVGTTRQTIISIEKEQYSSSLMLAYRLARVFDSTVETLCCLEENRRLEDEEYENWK